MNTSANSLSVSFPAEEMFERIARVTITNLGERLGFSLNQVNELKVIADSISEGSNSQGVKKIDANWDTEALILRFAPNPENSVPKLDLSTLQADVQLEKDALIVAITR